MKALRRAIDIFVSLTALLLFSPIIVTALLAVWIQDRKWPIYRSERLGLHGKPFPFYKVRTMSVGADRSGRHTAGSNDPNITAIGRFMRKTKIDELLQFWLVLAGQMNLVGPRPNIEAVAKLYTEEERRIFDARPGITDFASIVFSDLDDIMAGAKDVNQEYDQRIRPWKSRLALLYVDHSSLWLDIRLIVLTVVNVGYRPLALRGVVHILNNLNADRKLIKVARRESPPPPYPPPGSISQTAG